MPRAFTSGRPRHRRPRLFAPFDAHAERDFTSLSLEELGQVKVTSVSKRPEPLARAAAAVYVITADDIRRSGARTLAEALRLAPNLEVARINSQAYTIRPLTRREAW